MPYMPTVYFVTVSTIGAAFLSAAQPVQSLPLKSAITQVQPMTGIVLWSDSDVVSKEPKAITLEFRYCGYNEVVKPNGEYDYRKIEQVLDEIASRNHQAVLRFQFCYPGKQTTVPDFVLTRSDYDETIGNSEKKKTHFCDWSNKALQNFTLDFYTKFAQRFDSDQRIAFLQTGFGLWAEYHIYDGPKKMGKTFPSKEYQARFFRHMHQQFKRLQWSVSVDAADYDYTPLEDNQDLLSLNFGVFDDSFLCKQHATVNAVNWKILDSNRWKRQPAGGEFSYYTAMDQKKALNLQGPHGVSFEDAAKQFHISYMIGNDQPRYQSMERIKTAGMATGYRFQVTSATFRDGTVTLSVTNNGVAPIYRDAWFAAGQHRSTTSLKGLLPGETRQCLIEGVGQANARRITIQCDSILPTQSIQFEANLQ